MSASVSAMYLNMRIVLFFFLQHHDVLVNKHLLHQQIEANETDLAGNSFNSRYS